MILSLEYNSNDTLYPENAVQMGSNNIEKTHQMLKNILIQNSAILFVFFVLLSPELLPVSGTCVRSCAFLAWRSPAICLRVGSAWGLYLELS